MVSLAGPGAQAQSERLLEATRLQRASALEMAQAELAACTRKGCAQAPQLSFLVGSLLLSRGEPREALAQLRKHPAPPLLAPYRSFDIGQALFYMRDFRAAAQAFSEATTAPGAVANRAVARAGEALLRAGEAGPGPPPPGAGAGGPGRPGAARRPVGGPGGPGRPRSGPRRTSTRSWCAIPARRRRWMPTPSSAAARRRPSR